jgi:vacuolar-type H+-ATPase subunit E/Vma4
MSEMYSWSIDEEHYHGEFATREEALEEALDGIEPRTVWTGRNVPADTASSYLGDVARSILDSAIDNAVDEVGEAAESWLSHITREQEADLNRLIAEAFDAWATAHGLQPTFWSVTDLQEHTPAPPVQP